MKNLSKVVLLLALFVVGQSCSDLLDNAKPSTAVSQEVALSDPGTIDALRAGMYDRLHTVPYSTVYMLGPEVLADNISNRAGTNRLSGFAENSNGTGMLQQLDPDVQPGYTASYSIINDANLLISGIEDGVLSDSKLKQYRGEGYFMRAFALHHLVRTLGYEPGMTPSTGPGQGFNLGVIIRTKPTLKEEDASFKPRATVSEVYDQIRNDLDKAINLLSEYGTGNPIYANEAAAEALYARVELYAQNYSAAETHAQNAMDKSGATLASEGEVSRMFNESTGQNPEAIFLGNYNVPAESVPQPINYSLNVYTAQQWLAQVPTQDVMDLYSNDDARLSWFGPCFDDVTQQPQPNCLATHPAIEGGNEALEIQKWNAERGNYTDNVPYFRVAEMKLIQAEARLKGASGIPATPLNDLRGNRGLGDITPGTVDMQDILDERRREFIAEGQRFYDLKRLGMDIRKAPGTGFSDVQYYDHRVLDNVPFNEVSLSQAQAPEDSVLVQNPGYNQ